MRDLLNLTLAGLLVLTACVAADVHDDSRDPANRSDPTDLRDEPVVSEVEMNVLERGSYGRMAENVDSPGRRAPFVEIASSAAELESLWSRYIGQDASLPKVSFDRSIVVLLLMPPQPTGGYGIEPESVALSGSTVEVHATLHQPGQGAIVTQAFTAPYAVVQVDGVESVDEVKWVNQGRTLATARVE